MRSFKVTGWSLSSNFLMMENETKPPRHLGLGEFIHFYYDDI